MEELLILLALYVLAGPIVLLFMALSALGRARKAREQAEELEKSVEGLRAQIAWLERRLRTTAVAVEPDEAAEPADTKDTKDHRAAAGPAMQAGRARELASPGSPDPPPPEPDQQRTPAGGARPADVAEPVTPATPVRPETWRGALGAAKLPAATPSSVAPPPGAGAITPPTAPAPAPESATEPLPPSAARPGAAETTPPPTAVAGEPTAPSTPAAAAPGTPPPLPPRRRPEPSPDAEAIPWRRWLDAFGLQPPRPREVGEAVAAAWWVTRIGMLLGIIAAVFFGVYVSQTTGPWLRLAQLLAVSIGVTWVGLWQERTLARFGQVLTGGGLALLFFTCYGAAALPALRVIDNPALGALVQALSVAGILGFALWRRSEPVGAMAIGFGYVACWFAQAHGLQPWTLGGLWVLAATGCALQFRFQWHTARAMALAGSYSAMALLVMLVWPQQPPGATTLLIWLLALAGVFGASCQHSLTAGRRGLQPPPFAAIWCLLNSSAASALGLVAFVRFHPDQAGWFFLSFTLLWLALAWRLRVLVPATITVRDAAAAAVFPSLIIKASALLCLWIIDTLGGSLQAPAVALQGFGLLWLLRRERSVWLPLAMAVLLTVVMPWLAWLEWQPVALGDFMGGAQALPPWPQPAHLGGLAAALLALTVLTLTRRWRLLDHLAAPLREAGLWWARFILGLMLPACLLLPWQGNGQGLALLALVLALAGCGLKAGAGRLRDPLPSAAIGWAPFYLLLWTGFVGDLHQGSSLALAVAALLVLLGAHAMVERFATAGTEAATPAGRWQVPALALTVMAMLTIWQPLWWTLPNRPAEPDARLLWWFGAMLVSMLVLARQLPRPAAPAASGPDQAQDGMRGSDLLALMPWALALGMAVRAVGTFHLPWMMAIAAAMALPGILAGVRGSWWTGLALLVTGFGFQWLALATATDPPAAVVLWPNPLLLIATGFAVVIAAGGARTAAADDANREPGQFQPAWLVQAALHLAMMVTLVQIARWHFDSAGQLATAVAISFVWLVIGRLGRPRPWLATACAPLAVLLAAAFHATVSWVDSPVGVLFGLGGHASAGEVAVAAVAALLLPLLLPAVRARVAAILHARRGEPVPVNTGELPAGAELLAAAGVATGWWLAAITLITPGWVAPGLAVAALAAAMCRRLLHARGLDGFSLVLSVAAVLEGVHALAGDPAFDHAWLAALLAAVALAATGAAMLGSPGRLESDADPLRPAGVADDFRTSLAWSHALAPLALAFAAWTQAPEPFSQVVTVCWGASAAILFLLGLGARLRAFRMAALIGFAACILRMFAVDVHEVIERIVAFAVVAVVLLFTGYLYSRLRHWVDPPDKMEPDQPGQPPAGDGR